MSVLLAIVIAVVYCAASEDAEERTSLTNFCKSHSCFY